MIDIIIVNYNSTEYVIRCLSSLESALDGTPSTIFVQDNGSEDGVDRVNQIFPLVVLRKSKRNVGFAKGVNSVLRSSGSPYVMLLNPDTVAGKDFVKPILRYLEGTPEVGVLGPKIFNQDGSVQASARSNPTPLTALFGRSSLMSRVFPQNPFTTRNLCSSRSDGVTPMDVDWVSGACMVVRRKALDDVGLMDERFFMYWEDADWCRRMWEKGWRVVYFPESSVVHFVGGSSEHLRVRSILEFHKSVYRLFEKYNTRYPTIIRPLVIGGLALRLCAVMVMNGMRIVVKRNR